MISLMVFVAFIVLIYIGLAFLQRWLCRRPQRWAGLVLPALCLLLSLAPAVVIPTYSFVRTEVSVIPDGDEESVTMQEIETRNEQESIGVMMVGIIPIVVILNIPTFLFSMIYTSEQKKRKENEELRRMNILDL